MDTVLLVIDCILSMSFTEKNQITSYIWLLQNVHFEVLKGNLQFQTKKAKIKTETKQNTLKIPITATMLERKRKQAFR